MEVTDRDSTGEQERGEERRPEYLEVLAADAEVRAHTQPGETSAAIRQAVRQRLGQRR